MGEVLRFPAQLPNAEQRYAALMLILEGVTALGGGEAALGYMPALSYIAKMAAEEFGPAPIQVELEELANRLDKPAPRGNDPRPAA